MLAPQTSRPAVGGTGHTPGPAGTLVQNRVMPAALPSRRQLLAGGLLWPLQRGMAQATPNPAAGPAARAVPTAPIDTGRVWRVGAGQAVDRIADAVRQAADGDTILIQPGTYRGDVGVIHHRRLRLIGLGPGDAAGPPRPRLEAAGQHAEGKAMWVVRGGDIQIENLDFDGARVPDGNGAAIRFERGQLTLRDCGFSNHQTCLLTSDQADARLSLDHCQFSQAPANPTGLPHLVYVGRIARLRMRACQLRQGLDGHLLKSRARQTVLHDNLIDDGPQGQASYEIDLPEGGDAWIESNTVVQAAATRNAVMLAYGAEGGRWPVNRLVLRRNTFINRLPAGGWFVRVWADRLPAGGLDVDSQHNHYLGPGSLALGPHGHSAEDRFGPAP